MTIAVNTRAFSKKYIADDCIKDMITTLAKESQKHSFVFFNDKSSQNILTAKLWHTLKLPALLKKNKVDLLINVNSIQPVNTSIPQLQIIDTPEQLQAFKKNIAATFHLTKKIIATSQYVKNKVKEIYKIEDSKINIVYKANAASFFPMEWNEKQAILEKYSAGKEYFLAAEKKYNDVDLTDLLKAFSVFKKWQKSNLQLIIVSKATALPKSFIERLKTYKYKNEIILLNCEDDTLPEITAAAYSLIHLNETNSYLPVIRSIQCNVPVITSEHELMKEICGDAALYNSKGNFNDIAKNMILVYKDESLRNELIKNGMARINDINYAAGKAALNKAIEETLQG